MSSIDQVIRNAGFSTSQQSAEQIPGDQGSFVDATRNAIEYHNNKARKKFKELKFLGMVLRAQVLNNKEQLQASTSAIFANNLLEDSVRENSRKIWRLFVHIPEVSGLLPQPSFREVSEYRVGNLQDFEKFKYEATSSMFPKFYCVSNKEPKVMDIWKVSFHDENFMYYGQALSFHSSAGSVLREQR